jgi:glycosyltransferase involved in cell wall biosynthesis
VYNVLFIAKWYPNRMDAYNGIFVQAHARAVALRHKVAVVFAHSDPSLKGETSIELTEDQGVLECRVYYPLPANRISGFIAYFKAIQLGRARIQTHFGSHDLTHAHVMTRTALAAWWIQWREKIPFVITEHWTGYMPADGRFKGGVRKWLLAQLTRRAVAVTTVSKNLQSAMRHHGLLGEYVVVPNVVRSVVPEPHYPPALQLINVSDLVDEMKQVSGIIKAMPLLIKRFPSLKLILVGDGKDRGMLEKMTRDLHLEESVVFKGYISNDEVYRLIHASSLLVVNSLYESFSVAAAEALACGVPVVTTECGGPEEFVHPGNGIVVEPGNRELLTNAIAEVLLNRHRYNHDAIRKEALELFSAEAISKAFDLIYQSVQPPKK